MKKLADFLMAREEIPRWFYITIMVLMLLVIIDFWLHNSWQHRSIWTVVGLAIAVVVIWMEHRYERRTNR